ncbi:MAG TPA: cytochrome c oxidase subunit 2A [Gemmatimonadales bacterium]|nr:cytochrome c oxidase subunit 2A [Gemmatimonadales bacterium]
MTQEPTHQETHPRGTLFLIGIYGVLFVLSWFAVYGLLYLKRGGVTP